MDKLKLFSKISLVIVTLLFTNNLVGQKYDIGLGLRWGGDFGISASERIDRRITLEQNFNSENTENYYSAFALIKYHKPIITSRFNMFYGGGIGVIKLKEIDNYPESHSLSLLFQLGLEHTINRVTFYVALEPYFYQSNSSTRFKMHKVFAAKYVIVKRKAKWKKKLKNTFSFKKKKKKNKSKKTKKKINWKFWKKK